MNPLLDQRVFGSLTLSAAHETAISSYPLYLQQVWKEIQPGIHVRLQNNGMHRKRNPFCWIKFMEMVVNFSCFHSFRVEISAVMGCRLDGAINAWYHHRGQINWEGTCWERKMLVKQLEGVQENKKRKTKHNELHLRASKRLVLDPQSDSGPFRTRKCLLRLQM